MSKSRNFKGGGFIATLATGALMVGTAVTGTGAYFTDSEAGTISANSGHLSLDAGVQSSRTLGFNGLMPGVDQTKSIDFSVDLTDGKSDVWMVFDQASDAYRTLTGAKVRIPATSQGTLVFDGGLGRYGHIKIGTHASGDLFESYNLANRPAYEPDGPVCGVSTFGHMMGTHGDNRDATPAYCGIPGAILIAKDLTSGTGTTLNVTFGLTGRATDQNQAVAANVPFKIVATQAGIAPSSANPTDPTNY